MGHVVGKKLNALCFLVNIKLRVPIGLRPVSFGQRLYLCAQGG
jgi:hypothetical protein